MSLTMSSPLLTYFVVLSITVTLMGSVTTSKTELTWHLWAVL